MWHLSLGEIEIVKFYYSSHVVLTCCSDTAPLSCSFLLSKLICFSLLSKPLCSSPLQAAMLLSSIQASLLLRSLCSSHRPKLPCSAPLLCPSSSLMPKLLCSSSSPAMFCSTLHLNEEWELSKGKKTWLLNIDGMTRWHTWQQTENVPRDNKLKFGTSMSRSEMLIGLHTEHITDKKMEMA